MMETYTVTVTGNDLLLADTDMARPQPVISFVVNLQKNTTIKKMLLLCGLYVAVTNKYTLMVRVVLESVLVENM